MGEWLLIDAEGDPLHDRAKVEIEAFATEGRDPTPKEIEEACMRLFARQREIVRGPERARALELVSLAGMRHLEATPKEGVDVRTRSLARED